MALTEQKVMVSVEGLPSVNAINARFDNQILRDGEAYADAAG